MSSATCVNLHWLCISCCHPSHDNRLYMPWHAQWVECSKAITCSASTADSLWCLPFFINVVVGDYQMPLIPSWNTDQGVEHVFRLRCWTAWLRDEDNDWDMCTRYNLHLWGLAVEHACYDPKGGELCLWRSKSEETLMVDYSDADVQIVHST